MIGDYQRDIADDALKLCEEIGEQAKAAAVTTRDALKLGEQALDMAKETRAEAARLAEYFARMAIVNNHEPRPGDVPYTGAQAFRHAADLLGMLARGEKII